MNRDQARLILNEAREGADVAESVVTYCLWVLGDLADKPGPAPQAVSDIVRRLDDDRHVRRSLSVAA
jgi:hypothetical protein